MLLSRIVEISESVSATSSRSEKTELLAELLQDLDVEESPAAVSYLSGKPRQSPLGVGPATVYGMDVPPASSSKLEVLDVDGMLEDVAEASGPGSQAKKKALLSDLLGRATPAEQDFLRGLMVRNLRQGALEGIMGEALARALGVPADRVRRAAMLEGDLVAVASRALVEGPAVLDQAMLDIFTPVQPMLAKTAPTAAEAVEQLGPAFVELKLDGARIQVHRSGEDVAIYTRNLRDVTDSLPEAVELVLGFTPSSFILDGESLLMAQGGLPGAFQDSMSRFGSSSGERPSELSSYFFDCLQLDGEDLIDRPLRERRSALESFVPDSSVVDSILTDDPGQADAFFDEAVAAGFEGVVVKDPDEVYVAGRRGSGWLKVKPTHTLDLVVLAAEWGSGRRQGWLSNLHLGARDPAGGFVMLGKTFKGLTDEMLEWQTSAFLELERRREGGVVQIEPEIVYEIAFDGVQRSSRYPGGVALRFARVKRHRDDKTPEEADTIDTVRSFLPR